MKYTIIKYKYTTAFFALLLGVLFVPHSAFANHYDYDYNDYGARYYGGSGLNYEIRYGYNSYYPSYNSYSYSRLSQQNNMRLDANCYIAPTIASAGQSVHWRASVSGGDNNNYRIIWSGSDGLYGVGDSVSFAYNTPGYKTAQINVSSGGQSRTVTCSNSVYIRDDGGSYYDTRSYDALANYNYSYGSYSYDSYNYGAYQYGYDY